MLITENFVILNHPKTGSSFVRKVFKQIHENRRNKSLHSKLLYKLGIKSLGYTEHMCPNPSGQYVDQHGFFDQIPEEHKHKKIYSVVRDPYQRLYSAYTFGWWKKYPPISTEQLEKHFPHFPDLSFMDYIDMRKFLNAATKRKYDIAPSLTIGNQTIRFIQMFFKNHRTVLANINENYILSGAFSKDLCDVTFLKNETLNDDLITFLSHYDYSAEELAFIKNHEKVNVSKKGDSTTILDQTTIDYISAQEWILFEILSSLGINYKREHT